MNFGARLKQIRQDRNLTQPQFAEVIGIEQSYLSKLENDKSQPSAEMFGNIVKALGMSAEAFLVELDPATQAALGHIPQVTQVGDGVQARRLFRARRHILASAAAVMLGFALMLAANDGIFFPNKQYNYLSKGVLADDEADNALEQIPKVLELQALGKVISREDHLRQLAEFEARRIRHVTIEAWQDRGSVYTEKVAGGRRKFELSKVRPVKTPANTILQYVGALCAFAGVLWGCSAALTAMVAWRLRAARRVR